MSAADCCGRAVEVGASGSRRPEHLGAEVPLPSTSVCIITGAPPVALRALTSLTAALCLFVCNLSS